MRTVFPENRCPVSASHSGSDPYLALCLLSLVSLIQLDRGYLLFSACWPHSRVRGGGRKFSVDRSNLASVLSRYIQSLNLGSEEFSVILPFPAFNCLGPRCIHDPSPLERVLSSPLPPAAMLLTSTMIWQGWLPFTGIIGLLSPRGEGRWIEARLCG